MVSSRLAARSKLEEDNKLAEPAHSTLGERSRMTRSPAMNKPHKMVGHSPRRRILLPEQDEL